MVCFLFFFYSLRWLPHSSFLIWALVNCVIFLHCFLVIFHRWTFQWSEAFWKMFHNIQHYISSACSFSNWFVYFIMCWGFPLFLSKSNEDIFFKFSIIFTAIVCVHKVFIGSFCTFSFFLQTIVTYFSFTWLI